MQRPRDYSTLAFLTPLRLLPLLQPFLFRFGVEKLSDLFTELSTKKVKCAAIVVYDSWTCEADKTLFKLNLLMSDF